MYNDIVFVGTYTKHDYSKTKTARTNKYAIDFLTELFPNKRFIPLDLKKNDKDPYRGILHLDCTFMPVGKGKALIYRDGFAKVEDYNFLINLFGRKNVFEISTEEMYWMYTNVFSISPEVVVSEEHFTRMNRHMTDVWGLTVETVPYREVSKMGGLLRCSTLPLVRG